MGIKRAAKQDILRPNRLYYFCDMCDERCTAGDHCYGCEHYVCEKCYGPDDPAYFHELADHKRGSDDQR